MSDAPDLTLGELIDLAYTTREAKRATDAESKRFGEELDRLEGRILRLLDENKTTMSRGRLGSAAISEDTVFSIGDDDTFFDYVDRNKAYYLLQRRVASNAVKEKLAMGEEVPGLKAYLKRTISLKKV